MRYLLLLLLGWDSALVGFEYQSLSVLVWDNTAARNVPVFTIDKDARRVTFQAVNMIALAAHAGHEAKGP